MLQKPGSIKQDDFIDFLASLRTKDHVHVRQYILVDNLAVHRTLRVRDFVKENNQELVFNAPYSSEFNPVEQLWAHAKKYFRRELLDVVDFNKQATINALVEESLLQVRSETLKSWVYKCV